MCSENTNLLQHKMTEIKIQRIDNQRFKKMLKKIGTFSSCCIYIHCFKALETCKEFIIFFFHRADNITRLVNLAKFQHDYKQPQENYWIFSVFSDSLSFVSIYLPCIFCLANKCGGVYLDKNWSIPWWPHVPHLAQICAGGRQRNKHFWDLKKTITFVLRQTRFWY